jgi:hypothetical protein
VAALLASSPDLMWLYRYYRYERKGKTYAGGRLMRFHQRIQWFERPWGHIIEVPYSIVILATIGAVR